MDAVADAIVDVGLSKPSSPPFAVNLVHPNPVPWSRMILDVRMAVIRSKQLKADALPVVHFHTWLEALQAVVDTPGIENEAVSLSI